MANLLMYIGELERIDVERVRHALIASGRMEKACSSDQYLLECDYRIDLDFTTVRILPACKSIGLDGEGDASLEAALSIQMHYPERFHLIDDVYSFDIMIDQFESIEDLRKAIIDAEA
jgi:hypothetical protein